MPHMMFLSFRSIECKRKGDKRGGGYKRTSMDDVGVVQAFQSL
jgi:hypothetical protein